MKQGGTYFVAAPIAGVWAALNDESVLKKCIVGCSSLQRVSTDKFVATVTIGFGPIKASFSGTVQLTDIVAPTACVLVGEGVSKTFGTVRGSAHVNLQESGDYTGVVYSVDVSLTGKIARLSPRLVEQTAKYLTDAFFKKFADQCGELIAS